MSTPLNNATLSGVDKKKQQGTQTNYTFIKATKGPTTYYLWRPEADYTTFVNAMSAGQLLNGDYITTNNKIPEGETQAYNELTDYYFSPTNTV